MPRIVVFLGKGNLDALPSLRDTLRLLSEDGFSVEVVAPEDPAFSRGRALPGISWTRLPCHIGGGGARGVGSLLRLVGFLVGKRRDWRGAVAFGVDAEGMLLARVGVPRGHLVHVSMEIYCPGDSGPFRGRLMGWLEGWVHRKACFVVIQDQGRADLLAEVHRFRLASCLLPNGTAGGVDDKPSETFRRRLGIRPEQKVILHVGSVDDWTQCLEAVRAASEWPSDWVLVVQCRKRPNDGFLRAATAAGSRGARVEILSEPLPSEELGELVRNADVGLAFYKPVPGHVVLGRNLEALGASSGKVAQYFKAGVPVVTSNLPSLQRVIGSYGGCVAVTGPGESRKAIEQILSDRQRFSAGARRCFEAEFAIEPHVRRLAGRLRALEVR